MASKGSFRPVRFLVRLILGGLALGLIALVLAAPVPFDHEKAGSTAIPPGEGGTLDRLALADPPGTTRVRLLDENLDAFAARWLAIENAQRSLDLQYYIWHEDKTGGLIAEALVRAADRGVRVRVLLDDLDARPKSGLLATADLHPQIEVRVWNPFRFSANALRTAVEVFWRGGRLNRRMHNKSFIADQRLAIVGGRNIGDRYFGADSQVSFTDLDVGLLGTAAQDASQAFDRYWNHPAAVPLANLRRVSAEDRLPGGVDELRADLAEYRQSLAARPYLEYIATRPFARAFDFEPTYLLASADVRLAVDDPDKVYGSDRESGGGDGLEPGVLESLVADFGAARTSLDMISPYFVPGESGTEDLIATDRRGVATRILTNSLAANDVAAVHGGYARYRERLVRGGVELFELMPEGETAVAQSLFGSSRASLHTKAAMVDRRRSFIGSFNLDPRSALHNTEMGVWIDSPQLTERLIAVYETALVRRVWRLGVDTEGIFWERFDGVSGEVTTPNLRQDPQASRGRRWTALLARWLPIEPLL